MLYGFKIIYRSSITKAFIILLHHPSKNIKGKYIRKFSYCLLVQESERTSTNLVNWPNLIKINNKLFVIFQKWCQFKIFYIGNTYRAILFNEINSSFNVKIFESQSRQIRLCGAKIYCMRPRKSENLSWIPKNILE